MPEDHPALLLYGVEIHAQSSNTHPSLNLIVWSVTFPFSQHPGKEKAENLFQDFLLDGAAGGRLVFSLESSGQVGPKMKSWFIQYLPLFFSRI